MTRPSQAVIDLNALSGNYKKLRAFHVAAGGCVHLAFWIVHHQTARVLCPRDHIRDDVAARFSCTDTGNDAHILEALPLREFQAVAVYEKPRVAGIKPVPIVPLVCHLRPFRTPEKLPLKQKQECRADSTEGQEKIFRSCSMGGLGYGVVPPS